jgi:hypothetical protein
VFDYLSNILTTVPGIVALLLGALIVCLVLGTAFYLQYRNISMHLEVLSEAMDEQSRLMEKMRRTLADVTEVLVFLQAATRYRARTEHTASANPSNAGASASALRQELELLKAEISSELTFEPPLVER